MRGWEEAGEKSNYDESEDVDLGSPAPSSSAVLPVDADDGIDLCLDELAGILADVPIWQMKTKVIKRAAVAQDEVDGKDGGVFELNDWV